MPSRSVARGCLLTCRGNRGESPSQRAARPYPRATSRSTLLRRSHAPPYIGFNTFKWVLDGYLIGKPKTWPVSLPAHATLPSPLCAVSAVLAVLTGLAGAVRIARCERLIRAAGTRNRGTRRVDHHHERRGPSHQEDLYLAHVWQVTRCGRNAAVPRMPVDLQGMLCPMEFQNAAGWTRAQLEALCDGQPRDFGDFPDSQWEKIANEENPSIKVQPEDGGPPVVMLVYPNMQARTVVYRLADRRHCGTCNHEWVIPLAQPGEGGVTGPDHFEPVTCPKCGNILSSPS